MKKANALSRWPDHKREVENNNSNITFISISNWWSLTMQWGWLLSAHQHVMWALEMNLKIVIFWDWLETHHDSAFMWTQCETLIGCWPCWAKAAKMDVSRAFGCVLLKAELMVSWPKHLTTWLVLPWLEPRFLLLWEINYVKLPKYLRS